MKESTRRIIRYHGLRPDRAFHNWLYFAHYRIYVKTMLAAGRFLQKHFGGMWLLSRPFKAVYERYHSKVMTEADVRKILTLNRELDLGPHKQVIPYAYANKIIFDEPDFIVVMDCPCRLHREHHCEPVTVCMAVGRYYGQLWLEHSQKFHPRRITQEEALELVRSQREKGCITTAWVKVGTGGRTGIICNCCTCCCGGLEGMRMVKTIKGGENVSNVAPSGYKVDHDPALCNACGTCISSCMFDAITADDQGTPVYNSAACMGCGLCVEHCPRQARSLNKEFAEGLFPLDLDMLQEKQP